MGLDCNTKLLFPKLALERGGGGGGGCVGLASSNGSVCSSPGSAVPSLMAQQIQSKVATTD